MRIRISLTVDVDAERWATEYGVDRADIPEDVRTYVRNALAAAPVPMISVR